MLGSDSEHRAVPDSDSEQGTVPGSDSEHSAVLDSAIKHGMDTIGTITFGDVTMTNYD